MQDKADIPDASDPGANVAKGKVVRGGMVFVVARLVVQISTMLVTLLVARILEPSDYGLMASAGLLTGLAELLAVAGVGPALVHQAKVDNRDMNETFTFTLMLGALAYLLVAITAGPIAAHLEKPEFASLVRVVGITLLLMPVQAVAMAAIERRLEFGRITAVVTCLGVLQSALILCLALAGFGVWSLGIPVVVTAVLQSALLVYFSGWRMALARPTARLKPLLIYGSTIAATSLLWYAYRYADLAVITAILNPTALGFYWLALQLVSLPVEKLTSAINFIAFPTYCRLQDDPPRLRRWFHRIMIPVSLITVPALVGLALVAGDAIPLILGEKWRSIIVPLQLLTPIGIIMTVATLMNPVFNAQGRPDIELRFTGICAGLLPVSFLAGGWLGGLNGICVAWLLTFPVLLSALIYNTSHFTGLTLFGLARMHLPILGAAILMGLSVHATQYAMADAAVWQRLIVSIAAGGVSYLACIFVVARRTIIADLIEIVQTIRKG